MVIIEQFQPLLKEKHHLNDNLVKVNLLLIEVIKKSHPCVQKWLEIYWVEHRSAQSSTVRYECSPNAMLALCVASHWSLVKSHKKKELKDLLLLTTDQ